MTTGRSLRLGDTVDLTVEKGVYRGLGLARHEGQVVFVTRGVPGDRVRARVETVRKGYVRARPESLLVASPDRRDPPCPLFAACGGCAYQHVAYEAQLRLKEGILRESLQRAGRPWGGPDRGGAVARAGLAHARPPAPRAAGRPVPPGPVRGGVAPRRGPRRLPPDVARAPGRRAGPPRRLRRRAPPRARRLGGGARRVRRRADAGGGALPRWRPGGRHRPRRRSRAAGPGSPASASSPAARADATSGSRGSPGSRTRPRASATARTCCRSSRPTATCSIRS